MLRRAFGLSLLLPLFIAHGAMAAPPVPGAKAAILMDAQSGQVLYEKNGYLRRAPASTTKIMTALVAIERGRLSDQVRVSGADAATPGSKMHLKGGGIYRLEDLLRGLLWRSGNDAAEAIAEHVGGNRERFIAWMNQRALTLGALNTRYTNPHGLTSSGHYSSAYDLAVIAREVLHQPLLAQLVSTREGTIGEGKGSRVVNNTNRLLWTYEGANGVKTGTTNAAGRCLVASATRDGWQLIAVVLHSPDRWGESTRLLDYGFGHFRVYQATRPGEIIGWAKVQDGRADRVPLIVAGAMHWVIPKEGETELRRTGPSVFQAPVRAGTAVGTVALVVDGRPVARTAVLIGRDVPARGWWERFIRKLRHEDKNS